MNFPRFSVGSRRTSSVESETSVVHVELSTRSLLVVLGLVAGVWLLINITPIILVLVTALMLVGALSPLVTWLEQKNVRRSFALCTVFGVAIALMVALAMITIPTLVT